MDALDGATINSVLWLGRLGKNGAVEGIGSGVSIRHREIPLLVTAKHVVGETESAPALVVRYNGKWNPVSMGVVAGDEEMDITVLNGESLLGDLPPIQKGTANTVHGTLGRALGFPMVCDSVSLEELAETIGEVNGRPIPIPAVVTSAIPAGTGKSQYASGYVNAGFSGGGVFYPVNAGNDGAGSWSLVGIVTERGAIQKEVEVTVEEERYRTVQVEPTGLVKFAKVEAILNLIERKLGSD